MRRPGRRTRKRRALERAAHDAGDLAFCMVNAMTLAAGGGHWSTGGGAWVKWPDGSRSRMVKAGEPGPAFLADRQRAGIDRSGGSLRTRCRARAAMLKRGDLSGWR